MTKSTSVKAPPEDFETTEISRIRDYFIYSYGICKMCGRNRSFKFNYESAESSIDLIPKLFKEKKILERQLPVYKLSSRIMIISENLWVRMLRVSLFPSFTSYLYPL